MKTLKIVLVWNSNVWKSSFLNKITGSKRQTSNYHWTTVDIFSSKINHKWVDFEISDLPWFYSFDNYSDEELIAKQYLKKEKYDYLVQIIDTKYKKRSLALTFDLMTLNKPIFLIFNKEKEKNSHWELIKNIEKELDISWIELNILEEKNINWLFFDKIINLKNNTNYIKKLENIFSSKKDKNNKKNHFNFIEKKLEKHFPQNKNFEKSNQKIDIFLLNKFIWIPFFLFLMWAIFQLTFTLWAYPMDFFDTFIVFLQWFLTNIFWEWLIQSLFIDWILWWMWAFFVFLSPILILFFLLNLIQESWYLARIAYLLENLMSKFWLTWKSFIPLLMWFWCNVPSIMALRTLWTFREKIITAMMIPFTSCSARLPIYTVLLSAFVEEKWRGLVLFWLYLFWIFMSFFTGFLLNKFLKWKKKELFIELPLYKIPSLKKAFFSSLQKWNMYIKKAWKIIFPLVVITWFLFTFPQNTWIEWTFWWQIWKSIEFIFEPLWFDWKISTALLAGLWAKEVFVNILATIYSLDWDNNLWLILSLKENSFFNTANITSLLIFILLYTPCISVIWVLKQELWTKWAIIWLIYPTVLAWILAFISYQILI